MLELFFVLAVAWFLIGRAKTAKKAKYYDSLVHKEKMRRYYRRINKLEEDDRRREDWMKKK